MRPSTRLFFLFSLFPLIYAEEIKFTLYFKGISTVKEASDKVNSLVKRVNADNQFVSADVSKIDCAEDANIAISLCGTVETSPILEITEVDGERVSVHGTVNIHGDSVIFKEVYRLFAHFVKELFSARIYGGTEKDWDLPVDKMAPYAVSSAEVESSKAEMSKEHALLVCYDTDGFETLAAVLSALQAADELKVPLMLLSCGDSTDPCCQKSPLPRIVDLFNGEEYQQYEGVYLPEKVADFVRMLRKPYLTKLNEDIVPHFRSGNLADFPSRRDTTIMLFSPNKTNEPYLRYESFARENHGRYHMGALVDSGVYRWPHHPAIIIGKPFERVSQALINWEDLSEEGIRQFVEEGSRPSIHYIFDGKAAHAVFYIPRPILFFFDKKRNTDATAFAKLASNDKIRRSLASFAVINGRNLFSVYLAELLQLDDREPSFVLYLPQQKCAHIEPVEKQSDKALESWLEEKLEEDCSDHPVSIDPESFAGNYLWERKRDLRKMLLAPEKESFHDEL